MKKITLLLNCCWLLANCVWAQSALSPDIKVEVKNEENINGKTLEFSPAFYENGIVFISDAKVADKEGLLDIRIKRNTMSIFLSRRNLSGELSKPVSFAKEITTQWHEGPLTFNKTNDKIFFSRNDFIDGKTEKASNGVVKQMIISADMNGDQWANQQELPFNDPEYDFVHPSINVDDDVLYFSSNRPGGYGGMDLWKVIKTGDTWGVPINLGPAVNSSANEVFPFIHADGTLFFSSNGHSSMGGGDIFFTKEYEGQFVAPVNLGAKFNTSSDDFGFIIDRDKRNGYFSSDREGGKGQDDIYSFFIDEELGEDIFKFPDGHPAVLASNGAINNADGASGTEGIVDGTGFGNQMVNLYVADRLTGAELDQSTIEYVDLEQLTKTEIITDQDGNIIQLLSSENGESVTLSTQDNVVKGLTDAEGAYTLKIGDGNYLVNILKEGYQPKQVLISAADQREEFMVLMDRIDNCATVVGLVINDSNDPIPGAKVIVESDGVSIQELNADANGNFSVCLECGKSYTIRASRDGKVTSRSVNIPTNCNTSQVQQLTLSLSGGKVLTAGTTIRLERIYYNFNDASIRPDAKDELNTLVSILENYPSMSIEIASHTDARGESNYNRQLSQRRADKVVAYLVSQGISASRLSPVGYGESQPLNECSDGVSCSELGHQYNRRTEIVVKELDNPVGVEYIANAPETIDPAPANVSNSSNSSSSSSGYGKYQVIAGSFTNPSNADDRLSRIQQLGFDGATVIRQGGVAGNIVLVASFASYNQARNLADEIENVHNINTYVKRGR